MTNRSLHIVLRTLLAATLICAMALLSSCGDKNSNDTSTDKPDTENTDGNTTDGSAAENLEQSDIKIDSFRIGYLSENEYNDGNFDDTSIKDTVSLDDRSNVYVIIDFSYTLLKNIPEDASVIFGAASDTRGVIDITIQEAPTSAIKETKSNSGIDLTAEFSLPEDINAQKSVRIALRIMPLGSGTPSLSFNLTATGGLKLYGNASREVSINRIVSDITYKINNDGRGYSVSSVSNSKSEIVIPDRLKDNLPITGVLGGVFSNRSKLESLTIGKNIVSIEGESAFSGCTSLRQIMVDGENPFYTVIDGCLYTKDGKTLIRYAPARADKSFSINANTTHIADCAFASALSLTEIFIPESVVSIGRSAFYKCNSVERITTPVIGSGIAAGNTHFGYLFGAETYENNGDSVPESLKTVVLNSAERIESYAFAGCTHIEAVEIRDTVKFIDAAAFKGCTALAEINIPASVTSLPFHIFSGCRALTRMDIPSTVTEIGSYAFEGCESLSKITIPDAVTNIGSFAFSGCTALESIKLPDNVTVIQMYLFQNCRMLTSIEFSDAAAEIQSGAFSGCASLTEMRFPSGITAINDELFLDCVALKSVVIPYGLTAIGYAAFKGCTALSELDIPETVEFIRAHAFEGCTALTAIKIPDLVDTLKEYAFSDCSSLTEVVLGRNLYTIEKYVFNDCSSLTEITIPYSVKEIYKYAFYGCRSLNVCCESTVKQDKWENAWNYSVSKVTFGYNFVDTNPDFGYISCGAYAYIAYCKKSADVITVPSHIDGFEVRGIYSFGLGEGKKVVLPNTLRLIGRNAFKGYDELTEIVIPDSVTYLGLGAFEGCTSLTSAVIGDGITFIPAYAFNGCSNLKTLKMGSGILSIEMYAFSGCSSLTEITLPKTLTAIGYGSFYGCASLSDVYFSGGENEFNFTLDSWNESFEKATKHYTESH